MTEDSKITDVFAGQILEVQVDQVDAPIRRRPQSAGYSTSDEGTFRCRVIDEDGKPKTSLIIIHSAAAFEGIKAGKRLSINATYKATAVSGTRQWSDTLVYVGSPTITLE